MLFLKFVIAPYFRPCEVWQLKIQFDLNCKFRKSVAAGHVLSLLSPYWAYVLSPLKPGSFRSMHFLCAHVLSPLKPGSFRNMHFLCAHVLSPLKPGSFRNMHFLCARILSPLKLVGLRNMHFLCAHVLSPLKLGGFRNMHFLCAHVLSPLKLGGFRNMQVQRVFIRIFLIILILKSLWWSFLKIIHYFVSKLGCL